MNLKTLVVATGILLTLSLIVFISGRTGSSSPQDARIGQAVLTPEAAREASRIIVRHDGNATALTRSNGAWVVEDYHALPADFSALARYVDALTSAKVIRVATSSPERISRLQLDRSEIALADAAGREFWSLKVGSAPESGGRFIRFGTEEKAYVADLNLSIDASPRGWAQDKLLAISGEDVAKLELLFEDGRSLALSRTEGHGAFVSDDLPEGTQLKRWELDSLVRQLSGLRFIETADPEAPQVRAAQQHARTAVIETFSGDRYTVALGRLPEADGDEDAPSATRPVYAFITSANPDDPINALMQRRAFEIAEWAVTFPEDREALIDSPEPVAATQEATSDEP